MFFTRGKKMRYYDRGDVDAYDRDTGYFTKDGTWRTCQLGYIFGYKPLLVLISLRFRVLQTGRGIAFRQKGNTNEINIVETRGVLTDTPQELSFWVMTDAAGDIEYKITTGSYTYLDLVVRGWIK